MTVDIHFTWMKYKEKIKQIRHFFTLDKGLTIYSLTVPLTGSKDQILFLFENWLVSIMVFWKQGAQKHKDDVINYYIHTLLLI